jgi:23S rRNA pseudouridine1911/1915/1917 synthase
MGKRLIENKLVFVNGEPVTRPAYMVKSGDHISVHDVASDASSSRFPKSQTRIPLLYEDDDVMVLNKPAGISVHPGSGMSPGQETVLSVLSSMFAERSIPFHSSSVLVHRLDKDTTGCLLVAKNVEAHHFLQKQFIDRTVSKQYLAIVAGIPIHPKAVIDAPVGRHSGDRTKMSVHSASKSREAKTSYIVLGSNHEISALLLTLHTGRTHQIRVHLRGIGYPVLGDDTYATPASRSLSGSLGIDTICLHAWSLAFLSPSGKRITIHAPLPLLLQEVLKPAHISVKQPQGL